MEERHLITLKLIQATALGARLHIRQCPYGETFFARYKRLLSKNPSVFYRFADSFHPSLDGGMIEPYAFNFISDNLHDFSLLVTDNEGIIEQDSRRFGVFCGKWRCLPARQPLIATEAQTESRTNNQNSRVMWASRIDAEKRPYLLPKIASRLAHISSAIVMDVYGKGVFDASGPDALQGAPNLRYLGPYNGFQSLNHAAYDAFIYTSACDGMPNVLLEAIAAGLPVIAPDVGGIREMIVDGETGLLLPSLSDGEDMAAAYALAIQRLCSDPELRRRLAVNALRRLTERHSPAAFMEAMQSIFGSIPSSPPRPQLSLSRSTDSVLGEVTHVC
jgi:glycosyltransferase involved in cell wall biosynthesis